jgi:hypothetical protein
MKNNKTEFAGKVTAIIVDAAKNLGKLQTDIIRELEPLLDLDERQVYNWMNGNSTPWRPDEKLRLLRESVAKLRPGNISPEAEKPAEETGGVAERIIELERRLAILEKEFTSNSKEKSSRISIGEIVIRNIDVTNSREG